MMCELLSAHECVPVKSAEFIREFIARGFRAVVTYVSSEALDAKRGGSWTRSSSRRSRRA